MGLTCLKQQKMLRHAALAPWPRPPVSLTRPLRPSYCREFTSACLLGPCTGLSCVYMYIYMYNSSQWLQSLSSALRGSAKRHARCPLFSQLGAVLVPRESSLLPADLWQGGMRTGRERSAHWRLGWHPSHVCGVLPVRKKGGNNCTTCNYLLLPQIFVENEFSQE